MLYILISSCLPSGIKLMNYLRGMLHPLLWPWGACVWRIFDLLSNNVVLFPKCGNEDVSSHRYNFNLHHVLQWYSFRTHNHCKICYFTLEKDQKIIDCIPRNAKCRIWFSTSRCEVDWFGHTTWVESAKWIHHRCARIKAGWLQLKGVFEGLVYVHWIFTHINIYQPLK